MSQTDPIADMLTRIRNASAAKLDTVEMPYSTIRDSIARVLKKQGYIQDYTAEGGGSKKILRLYLKYSAGRQRQPVIQGIKRVSRPGLRRYVSAEKLPKVKNGTGIALLSTSRGVITANKARNVRVGGEWLCSIW